MPSRESPPSGDLPDADGVSDPRARLLFAAIEQIEALGLGNATVRAIAAAAGMNVASVNYHFGSKANLVSAALDLSIANMMQDVDAYLERVDSAPGPVLGDLFSYLLEGALRYPRLSRAHLRPAFESEDYSGPFPTRFSPVISRLADAVGSAVPGLSRPAAERRVVAALSALLFPCFFAGLFSGTGVLDGEGSRRRYALDAAAACLAPAG